MEDEIVDIEKAARKFLRPSLLNPVLALRQLEITRRLPSLRISGSGLSEEGIPFVKLENGLIFYGYRPTLAQRYVHKYLLNKKTKGVVSKYAISVALDIIRRYLGPESERDYIKSGKYYDLEEGSTVVECGAYMGYYTMRVAEIVGESGLVIAIEPVEENLRLLSMNVERNHFHNVSIVPKAVWKERCVQTLFRKKNRQPV